MISASVDLSNLRRAFADVQRRASDWRKVMDSSGDAVRSEYAHEFAEHGPGWALNRKGDNSNVKTGDLRDGFCRKGAPGNVSVVTVREGRFGCKLDYATIIQNGGVMPRGGVIKARPIARDPSSALIANLGRIATGHFLNLAGTK